MTTKEYMKSLANLNVPPADREYDALEAKYEAAFGHMVPREMIPPSVSAEELKDAIKKCIASGKDDLFGLLGISTGEGLIY